MEINLRGAKIYYRQWGRGEDPTVLVLHGWGVDSSQYEDFGPRLAKHGYRVIVPDLPGFGNTPAPPNAWGVGEYVEWVREFMSAPPLMIRGGRGSYDKIILFGHSFGGRIAIKYALKYRAELRALILCASAGIKPPLTLKRIGLYCLAKIGKTIFSPPGLSWTGEILKRILYRVAGVNDYLRASGIMKEILQKAIREDLTSKLGSLEVPTLLLWGTEDRATPYRDGQTMARLIPNSKLVTFEGARHNLPKLIPDRLATEIIQYVPTIKL